MEANPVIQVPLSNLRVNPWQPRTTEGHVVPEAMVQSIRKFGLLQIPIGRPKPPATVDNALEGTDGMLFEVGDGWQRWQIYARLGAEPGADGQYSHMPLMIRDLTNQQMADLAVESNEKREALNPIELARFFKRYMNDFDVTQADLAEKFSLTQPAISNIMRLLNLQPEVQQLIISQEIPPTAGRSLLRVEDPKQQVKMAEWVRKAKPTIVAIDREVLDALRDNMRPLHRDDWPHPEFSTAKCLECPSREVLIATRYRNGSQVEVESPYCSNKDCWDRKQKSAKDKKDFADKDKKEKIEKALADHPGCVLLDNVPYDSYKGFGNSDVKPDADCKKCEDFKDGMRSYTGAKVEKICTNPKCYMARQRKATMMRNRFGEQQWQYRREKLLATIDLSSVPAPVCLALVDLLGDYQNIKVISKELGILIKEGDYQAKTKLALEGVELAALQKAVLTIILELYHQRDAYNQRGDAVSKFMVLVLGKDEAKAIDKAFVPDLTRPRAKPASEVKVVKASSGNARKCDNCGRELCAGQVCPECFPGQ
jgi:ParB/RepB/Spo0J family partition protein